MSVPPLLNEALPGHRFFLAAPASPGQQEGMSDQDGAGSPWRKLRVVTPQCPPQDPVISEGLLRVKGTAVPRTLGSHGGPEGSEVLGPQPRPRLPDPVPTVHAPRARPLLTMLPDPPGPAPRWLLDFASALHSRPCPCPTQTLPWLPVLTRAPGPQKATPLGNRVFAGVTKVGPEPTRSRAGPARREEVTQAGRRQEGADAATSQRTKEGPPRAPRLDTSGLQGVNLSRSKARPAPPGLRSLPRLRVLQSASHRPAQHCL